MLDLFAGSGALGVEALSRGARFCLFVEEGAAARAAIRRNVEALGLTGVTKIWRRDATKLGAAGRIEPFDLVFCDPPYGKGLGQRALAAAIDGGWADRRAIAVLEERAGLEVDVARALAGNRPAALRRYRDPHRKSRMLKAFSPLIHGRFGLCFTRRPRRQDPP